MNATQIQTTIAPLISFLAGLAAGKNLFGLDSATWTTILGSLAGAGMAVWSALASRQTALISTVANDPSVKSVTLTANATSALVDATPANVTK